MKKHRLDTIKGSQEIASNMKTISWPDDIHQTNNALVHFEKIIRERASSLWSSHEIEVAAMLASDIASREIEQGKLEQEGRVIVNASGNPVVNPRNAVVRDLSVMVKQYRQTLGIQYAAKGTPINRAKQNELAQEIEAGLISGKEKDDLSSLLN